MYKPNLAVNLDIEKLPSRLHLIAQPKIDGVRAVHFENGFTGRSLKPFKNRWATEFYSNPAFKGFDGELTYTPTLTASDLCRTTTSWVNEITGGLPFWNVFDILLPETERLSYLERLQYLETKVAMLPEELQLKVKVISYKCLTTLDQIADYHASNLRHGYEGTILRDRNSMYKQGRSTMKELGLMRLKDFADDCGEVIGLIEAEENGNLAVRNELGHLERSSHQANKYGKGMVGALEVLFDEQVIRVGAGTMTHAERELYWENKALILGKIINFRHMPYGAKSAPRHARFTGFREDNL